ncbi:unnamed protein product [Ceratitis capitata]|uniref:(Mediterranean fruit fly) hypothetical protein n=1 Tax=Ceratitis capitata TaxID=7213 RepID=A0A811VFC0_CERCA|nr:unnamed protein product [Ceratitis capitata]
MKKRRRSTAYSGRGGGGGQIAGQDGAAHSQCQGNNDPSHLQNRNWIVAATSALEMHQWRIGGNERANAQPLEGKGNSKTISCHIIHMQLIIDGYKRNMPMLLRMFNTTEQKHKDTSTLAPFATRLSSATNRRGYKEWLALAKENANVAAAAAADGR